MFDFNGNGEHDIFDDFMLMEIISEEEKAEKRKAARESAEEEDIDCPM